MVHKLVQEMLLLPGKCLFLQSLELSYLIKLYSSLVSPIAFDAAADTELAIVDLLWDTYTPTGTVAHPNAPIELDLYFRTLWRRCRRSQLNRRTRLLSVGSELRKE